MVGSDGFKEGFVLFELFVAFVVEGYSVEELVVYSGGDLLNDLYSVFHVAYDLEFFQNAISNQFASIFLLNINKIIYTNI
jgi:hypothetical protein